jgi:diguanylate cyclase (GGDEF)-like protein/PAS domain S-box-containing protein
MSATNPARRLLLINSHPERLETLEQLLKKSEKYQVLTASNSKDAVETLKHKSVDFIISNIELDGIDGWRLARLVRAGVLRCVPNIPYVIVSNTWCEHIAKTTAREFLVNELVAYEDYPNLLNLVDNMRPVPIEDIERASLLVVEDNPDTRHLVQRILKRRFKVDAAENGAEGIALWEKNDYDLVLLDIMLPGITGVEILNRIMDDKPDQSVVMMTANHSAKLVEELMLKGAADFIAKPFHAEQLRQVCETAARREDFIISSAQFADKVKQLNKSRSEYKLILDTHQHLLDQISAVVIELTTDGKIQFLNNAWEKLTGFSIKKSLGKPIIDFIQNPEDIQLLDPANIGLYVADSSTSNHFEFRLKNRVEQELWVEARFELTLAKDRKSRAISGTIEDITERKKAQSDLEYLAMHDDLTGLFNRHYFEIQLKKYSASAARGNGPHSILYVDLDDFKVINDTLGHNHGDAVIKDIAKMLTSRLRDADILARVGGDEFGLLLPNTNQHIALILADDLCRLVDEYPCSIDGKNFKINCSIGISEMTGEQSSHQEYMKQADIALYAAKKQGRNRAHIYSQNDDQSKELKNNFEWARRLHQAVADDNLVLHFQPVVRIDTLETSYYEALVRLKIDDKIVLPGEFIPALERENAMTLLDRQVIRNSFKYLAENPKLTKVAINLSAQGFSDERLLPLVKENLETYQVSPDRIIFELTESASLNNISVTKEIVSKISELGCEFSIDDFGTGFSTFNYLKQIPAQSVKIDGSFVVELAQNPIDLALVKAIYEVATALDKKTVAEFVENEQSLNMLREIGVTYAQGFYFSKPKPVEELF